MIAAVQRLAAESGSYVIFVQADREDDGGTLLLTVPQVAEHALLLPGAHERAHFGSLRQPMADAQA